MNPALLQQPIFQVTLPVVLAMGGTVWALISTNNKRLDDIRADLKEVIRRLDLRAEDRGARRPHVPADAALKTQRGGVALEYATK